MGRSRVPIICSLATVVSMLLAASVRSGGGLDPVFGDGGVVITRLTGSDLLFAIALQPDGKIVTGGSSNFGFTLVRYNQDGALDRTFGAGGTVFERFGPYSLAYGIAIQADGKILAAGYQQSSITGGTDFTVVPLVVRYNSDGQRDPSFGLNGMVTLSQGAIESAKAVAIQQDGKIVAAGNKMASTGGVRGSSKFAVSRLSQDGGLDPAFGSFGQVTTSFDEVDSLKTIVIQPDGKIIAVGDSGATDSSETDGRSIAIARYNPDGSLDSGFGTGGKVVTSMPEGAAGYGAALQSDGKLIVTGSSGSRLLVARYGTDGTLDPNFGNGGLALPIEGEGYSLAVQSDGKIVVGGSASVDGADDFVMLRFNTDGTLGPDFGRTGVAIMDVGSSAAGRSIALDSDGRIVMGGYIQRNPDSVDGARLALLAYQPASSDRCMLDAAGGDYVVFNPSGQYKFTLCGTREMTLSGTGSVTFDGLTVTIVDRRPDRVVKISFDTAANTGKAKIRMVMPDGVMLFTIKATNPHAVCSCAAR